MDTTPTSLEDAGPSAVDAPTTTQADDASIDGWSDAADAGPPPQSLVDEIEVLRTAEEGAPSAGDAGPGPEL